MYNYLNQIMYIIVVMTTERYKKSVFWQSFVFFEIDKVTINDSSNLGRLIAKISLYNKNKVN